MIAQTRGPWRAACSTSAVLELSLSNSQPNWSPSCVTLPFLTGSCSALTKRSWASMTDGAKQDLKEFRVPVRSFAFALPWISQPHSPVPAKTTTDEPAAPTVEPPAANTDSASTPPLGRHSKTATPTTADTQAQGDDNAFVKVPSDILGSMLGPLSSKENGGPNQGGMFTTPPLANEHVQAAVASCSASAVVLTPGVPTTTATPCRAASAQPPVATLASATIAHSLASELAAVSIAPSDLAMMLSAETE